jgi:hypothetical protein
MKVKYYGYSIVYEDGYDETLDDIVRGKHLARKVLKQLKKKFPESYKISIFPYVLTNRTMHTKRMISTWRVITLDYVRVHDVMFGLNRIEPAQNFTIEGEKDYDDRRSAKRVRGKSKLDK